MIWIVSFYLLVIFSTYLFFIYDDIKSKELGAFDGFSYLILAMSWPLLGLIILTDRLMDWFIIKRIKNESKSNKNE